MAWGSEFLKPMCSADGCDKPIKGLRYCNQHYQLFKRNGSPHKLVKTARQHPLYITWFEKKQNGRLCKEWLTFKTFCDAVGERPEGNFVLNRPDKNKLYGPDNWEWYEQLKKVEGETDKDWWARKWKDARVRNPDKEYNRNLQRKYGSSLEEYEQKLKDQNGVCAICKEVETIKFKNSDIPKRLAFDHCHNTMWNRELLCNRCNVLIGLAKDNVKVLEEAIKYIIKHKQEN
jgi:hypothetical protein